MPLTIDGDLSLAAGSSLDFEFGQADVAGGALNDLVNVGGNLVLDGTLNASISSCGAFDPGIYRVFNYGGALTDNCLDLGTMPGGSAVTLQTSVAGQVNLINTAGTTFSFWDGGVPSQKFNGAIDGGAGIWQASGGNNNWADSAGSLNAGFTDNSFAIFEGTAGTVRVDNGMGAVAVQGMQFATDGYVITGDALGLSDPHTIIRVGDGTSAGAGFTTTIDVELTGQGELVKTDLGILVLAGTSTYTGGTAINAGTLRVSRDDNLGSAIGGLSFDGGTLNSSADIISSRDISLVSTGTISPDGGTTLTMDGALTGAGSLIKSGGGTLRLDGSGSYSGGTTVNAGTLSVNGDYSRTSGANTVAGGTLGGNGILGGNLMVGAEVPLRPATRSGR